MHEIKTKNQIIYDALGYLLEDALLEEIIHVGQLREVQLDEVILNVGDTMQMIPIVLRGSIKVSQTISLLAADQLIRCFQVPAAGLVGSSVLANRAGAA